MYQLLSVYVTTYYSKVYIYVSRQVEIIYLSTRVCVCVCSSPRDEGSWAIGRGGRVSESRVREQLVGQRWWRHSGYSVERNGLPWL